MSLSPVFRGAIPSLSSVFPAVDFASLGVDGSQAPTLFIPDSTSGTYDFFVGTLDVESFTPGSYSDSEVQTFTNDVDLISGCAGVNNCLGFVGIAFADVDAGIDVRRAC